VLLLVTFMRGGGEAQGYLTWHVRRQSIQVSVIEF